MRFSRDEFRIGEWLVRPWQNRILRANKSFRVEPRVIEVLACLAERPGAVLSSNDIIRRVWPDELVPDDVLIGAISELRKAFGDEITKPAIIRIIPGRGYQLVGHVEWAGSRSGKAPDATGTGALEAGEGLGEFPPPATPKSQPQSPCHRGGSRQLDDVAGLLGDLRTGNSELAWSRFIESYGPLILQLVRLYEKDSESVRDGFLFVCEQLAADRFKRLRKYSPQQHATFATWLRSVVRNLCIDRQRRVSGRKRRFEFVTRLSDLEQQVYGLYYLEGFSLEQTWHQLEGRFDRLTEDQVSRAVERIYSLLTPRQLWLLSSRNRAKASLSQAGRESDTGIPDPTGSDLTPEELLIRKEELQRLTSSLLQLSVPERRLLRLRFEQGYSLRACAEALGLENPQRAHRIVSRILARLRILISA